MAAQAIKRVAIYARVSTANLGQDVTLQTRELERFAQARGWKIATRDAPATYGSSLALQERSQERTTEIRMKQTTRRSRAAGIGFVTNSRNFIQSLTGECYHGAI